ncbi:serine hydrolase domain-containing protein [Embleya sp. NPDC008237]|uniref:serine hydrolase domain-containing protein n=1 Tax=Embleya sp. NPDC008237 TaxID=3363978 RepID=UPI0036EC1AD3
MHVDGFVAPGFAPVQAAFEENFALRGEVGAALAVHLHGAPVVDLWGGLAEPDAGRSWEPDTVQVVWSVTKGLVATCLAVLIDRGLLDPALPVCRYWPEFAAAGKRDVTVAQLLSHQAGLPFLDEPITLAQVAVPDALADALAAQRPVWEPGSAHGYHAVTWGFYASELIRRVDGRTVGTFLAEEVAGPLGVDAHIGLPATVVPRLAHLTTLAPTDPALLDLDSDLGRAMLALPELAAPGADHDPDVLTWEVPSGLGVTNARALARVYAMLAGGGTLDGVRLLSPATVTEVTRTVVEGPDRILGEHTAFSLGFMKPETAFFAVSTDSAAFGHPGSGGPLAFADPASGLAFAYVTNGQSPLHTDVRALGLIDAVRGCLER